MTMSNAFTSWRDPASYASIWEHQGGILAPSRFSFGYNSVPQHTTQTTTSRLDPSRNSVHFSLPSQSIHASLPTHMYTSQNAFTNNIRSMHQSQHHSSTAQSASTTFTGGARPRTTSTAHGRTAAPTPPVLANDVDAWIDMLDENRPAGAPHTGLNPVASDVAMAFLVQQQLPRTEILNFDGVPTKWVEFITQFRDKVHNVTYLDVSQKYSQLVQHLSGQPKRAVKQFRNDHRGYVLSLKRLKFLFGQKSKIAEAEVIENNDIDGLTEFYYLVSDCLITLQQLRIFSVVTLCAKLLRDYHNGS